MKKSIVVEILLLFILAVLIAICVNFFQASIAHFNLSDSPAYDVFYKTAIEQLIRGLFSLFACIADICAMVIIAIRNFKVFQPLIEKHNARKEERVAARAAKTEAEKQKQIAELEKKLDELKKDDLPPSD